MAQELDPITGRPLNRLTNYNNSEPIEYRTDIDLSRMTRVGATPMQGTTGDVNLYQYDPSRYDNNIQPYELGNLEAIRAENQGNLDALGRATANLIGKTAVNVVGGLVGTAYGAADAIANGEVSKLWDNDLTTALDKASEIIGNYFQVYNSADYQDSNLISKALLHPVQFTDQVMDALSFTTGAILTEIISSGISSSLIAPRALKYFKNLGKAAEAVDVAGELGNTSSQIFRALGNAGNLTRQLATGAAYEASVEARHATMELRDKMYEDWLADNPGATIEQIPEDIKQDIDDRLSNAGLFTFLTNMALVGASNLVQFPKVFGAGYNTSRKAVDTSRLIRNAETGLFEDAAQFATRGERITDNIVTALRNPFMEGFVEEGGQSVLSGTAKEFWERKNDGTSKSTVEDFLSAFGNNLIDTYTTKEGWEEIGMGMIIGSLGAPGRGALSVLGRNSALGQLGFNEDGTRREIWTGGIAEAFQERARENQEIAAVIDDLNNNTNLFNAMKANYDFLVQADSIDRDIESALNAQNIFQFQNLKDDKIHAYVASRINAGLSDDLDTTIDQLNRMSPEELFVEFRGQEAADLATQEEKRNFKQTAINEFQSKINNTKEAYNIVNDVYKGEDDDVRDYLIYSIANAKNLDLREKAINTAISDLTNGHLNNLNLRPSRLQTIEQEIKSIDATINSLGINDETVNSLEVYNQQLKSLNDINKQLTYDEFNGLRRFAETDPVSFSLNKNKIIELLDDSRKVRTRRQQFIDTYNTLFTEEGQNAFKQRQAEVVAQREEEARIQEQQAAEQARNQERQKNINNIKNQTQTSTQTAEIPNPTISQENPNNIQKKLQDLANRINNNEDITSDEDLQLLEQYGDQIEPLLGGVTETEDNTITEEIEQPIVDDEIVTETDFQPEINAVSEIESNKDAIVERANEIDDNGAVTVLDEETISNRSNSYSIINRDLLRNQGQAIAYLGINKVRLGRISNDTIESKTFDIFDDNGILEINEFVDTRLFSQKLFNKGTKLYLKVPTYTEMSERGVQQYSLEDYNSDLDNIDRFPIGIYDESNTLIGYYPTRNNIERNVNPKVREAALNKNREIREFINSNRTNTFDTVVTEKGPGWIMADRYTVQKNLFNAFGDGSQLANNVTLSVAKSIGGITPKLYINSSITGTFTNGEVINANDLVNGMPYAIVPTSTENKFLAVPLKTNNIGKQNADLIVEAIRLFAKQNKTAQEKQSLANISEYNFNNFSDVTNFINRIMYTNSGRNANDSNTFRLFRDNLILSPTDPNLRFSLNDIVTKPSVRTQISDILAQRYYSVKLENLNNKTQEYVYYSLNDGIIQENVSPNFMTYLNDNNVLTSNVHPLNIAGNDFAFTSQPVIVFSDPILRPSETTSVESDIVTPEIQETPVEAVKKPRRTLGINPNKLKNKPIDLDTNQDFIQQTNINSAEDLINKCSK